jgi:hypothetical protein
MVSFGYFKHKQTNLEFAQKHFVTQSLIWVKINFDPTARGGGLDKINIHKVYNLQFFNDHRTSCLWFMKHYSTK